MRRTVDAIIDEAVEYGRFVAVANGLCRPDPSRLAEGGLALRPSNAGGSPGYAKGERATILTDGEAIGLFGNEQLWAEIRQRRLLVPDPRRINPASSGPSGGHTRY